MPTYSRTATDIRTATVHLEAEWSTRPYCVLARSGRADEHWQLYHPADTSMPMYTLVDGVLELHPDAPEAVLATIA